MNKSRLNKADELLRAQVKSEAHSLVSALVDWVATLPTEAQHAYWRVHNGGRTEPEFIELLCGGVLAVQPGDNELLEKIEFPADLAERMNALTPAVKALGVI